MLVSMHQTTWVGKVEGGLGRASCRRAGGDGWCFVRAVGCLWASFVWVATGEPLMLAYMHQTTWVGKVERGLGRASCRLMRRAVRQTRVAAWRKASGACCVGEHVVMRALGPLFVVEDFFLPNTEYDVWVSLKSEQHWGQENISCSYTLLSRNLIVRESGRG